MKFKFLCIFFANMIFGCAHQAKIPADKSPTQLIIRSETQEQVFLAEDLLHHPQARDLQLTHDPTHQFLTYRAVPLGALFADTKVDKDSTILFSCLDGFSAPIEKDRLLNTNPQGAVAYLAIEPPKQPWPPLKKGSSASAGPFYVVWENPDKSGIGKEEWPFQVVSFTVKPSAEKLYPNTVPDRDLGKTGAVYKGYQSFMKNCFSCHTMNGEGESRLGPDLNLPYNPTEYWRLDFLKKQIRNPQAVRLWPQGKMTGFNPASLSEADVHNIVLYLQHMAKRKLSRVTDDPP